MSPGIKPISPQIELYSRGSPASSRGETFFATFAHFTFQLLIKINIIQCYFSTEFTF